ncbi:MAG TPA: sensor histidine kinase [Candidatus Limnocylindrales bacterium]|nr:sensor histidine kinase [Candidatus Limnocylindrales bacterium]
MGIRPRDTGWFLTLAVGGLGLLVALMAVATRLATPSELAVIPTEAWPWTSNGVQVDPVSPVSDFRAGDLVVAMDGRSMEQWVESAIPFATGGAVPEAGPTVTFDVLRDGQRAVLEVTLQPYPIGALGAVPTGLVLYGAAALALAVVLIVQRPRSTPLRLLFVAAAANSADIAAWQIGLQPTDFRNGSLFLVAFAAAALFNVVFWSAIVHILAVYPVRSELVIRRPLVVSLIYLVPLVALLVLVLVAGVAGGTILDWVDRLASAMGLVASGMLVVIIFSTFAGYRRASPSVRRSVRIVAITLVVAAVATLTLLTLPIAASGTPLVSRGVVSIIALSVPVALAVAVVRDRLFQVGLLSRSRERVVAAREDERRKLRRDLHDGLAPSLAAAALKADLARQAIRNDPDAAERLIGEVGQEVRGAVGEIRRLSRDLRPPALDSLGLVGAIRQQAEGLGAGPGGNGVAITVDAPDALPTLPAAVEVAAYRIAVEAMMNVVRHAAAASCRVRIALVQDELQVDVIDDGTGITVEGGGVGTRAMRERAAEVGGDVVIRPAGPSGTVLSARLPVDVSQIGQALA